MSLGPIDEELDADLLFHDDGEDAVDDAASVSSAEETTRAAGPEAPEKPEHHASPDDAGGSSARSSLIHISLERPRREEERDEEVEEDQVPEMRGLAHTMPAHTGHIRMGSSVPVSIPMRWKKQEGAPDSPSTQHAPATFVPPHQLSQVNDFTFSFTGDSPSVAIKRERLRARNAILKSTGFLEPNVHMGATIGLQERNRLAIVEAGGLSRALQQQGNTMAAAAVVAALESA